MNAPVKLRLGTESILNKGDLLRDVFQKLNWTHAMNSIGEPVKVYEVDDRTGDLMIEIETWVMRDLLPRKLLQHLLDCDHRIDHYDKVREDVAAHEDGKIPDPRRKDSNHE